MAGILQRLGFTEKRRTLDSKRLTTWMPPPDFLAQAVARREKQAGTLRVEEEARQRELDAARTNLGKDHLDLS